MLRFGLGGEGEHTLEEIGKKFELSRERIRQIEHVAMEKLRASSRRLCLQGLLNN
jgi:RNA polymerase primary sigma factor